MSRVEHGGTPADDAEPQRAGNDSASEFDSAYPLRLAGYGLAVFAAYQVLHWGIGRWGVEAMARENGPVESIQVISASLGAVCLLFAAWRAPIGRSGLCWSGCVLGYAAARECDSLYETLLFDDAYKWLIGLPLALLAMAAAAKPVRQLVADLRWLMSRPAASLFIVAGICLTTLCQTLDRPGTWGGPEAAEAVGPVRILVEESCELFAYLLLAFSGIESLLVVASARAAAKAAPRKAARRRRDVAVPVGLGLPGGDGFPRRWVPREQAGGVR